MTQFIEHSPPYCQAEFISVSKQGRYKSLVRVGDPEILKFSTSKFRMTACKGDDSVQER